MSVVDESQEQAYPDHWLIAGGPCTEAGNSWRAGLCMRCPDQTADNAKVFLRAEDETDGDWLLRFRAMIDKHDTVDCDGVHTKPLH